MKRGLLRRLCRGLVGVLLFAQMAIAAYACPALSGNSGGAAAQGVSCEDMAGPMDAALPNLCAEHCHYGQQSDQASTLAVPAGLLTPLYPVAPALIAIPPPAAAQAGAHAARPLPHAVLHCCWRI